MFSDECDNRCLNGAICEQANCTCPAGFGGDFCQDKRKFLEYFSCVGRIPVHDLARIIKNEIKYKNK